MKLGTVAGKCASGFNGFSGGGPIGDPPRLPVAVGEIACCFASALSTRSLSALPGCIANRVAALSTSSGAGCFAVAPERRYGVATPIIATANSAIATPVRVNRGKAGDCHADHCLIECELTPRKMSSLLGSSDQVNAYKIHPLSVKYPEVIVGRGADGGD